MELNVKQSGIAGRTLKVFHRTARSGAIVKVAREHYLRNDIPCGWPTCQLCPQGDRALDASTSNAQLSSICTLPHIAIVDVDIMINKIDVLQDECFRNFIVPQTVWEMVKTKSPPSYKKMHSMVFSEDRGFFVFINEFHQDTYLPRVPGESSTERNERAVFKVAEYYAEHFAELKDRSVDTPSVVVLCDTVDAKVRAQKRFANADHKPFCFTFSDYVKGISNKPELADKLAAFESRDDIDPRTGAPRGRVLFPEHLSSDQVQTGLKSGKFKKGSFQVSRENYLEATVFVDDKGTSWFVQGLINCNRAVHEDNVAVELLPEEQWSCPARLLKVRDLEESEGGGGGGAAELDTDTLDEADENAEIAENRKRKVKQDMLPTARVVAIIKRNWRPYCGILLPSPIPGARRHLFAAAERRIPRIRVETRQADTLRGQRIVVSIDKWPIDSRYPIGHYVRSLGVLGDRVTENEVLLLEHDIPHHKFSQAVLDCLPETPWNISDEDRAKRRDLRHLPICSIDPPGCTDIDDALHCRRMDDGNWEVGVHIADVSHFVRPGTAMDKEASERGTTVYLCDQRIDMLPELLSGNLCSLRGGVERFAFSVIWKMTKDAETLSVDFCKSVIASKAAMTYQMAQEIIDDQGRNDTLAESLRDLLAMSRKLKTRRKANGALNLASMEIRFNIDSESHDPISVQEKKQFETNSLVEEFMLLANISVAQKISDDFSDCAVLRRHPIPAPANYKPVIMAAQTRGFSLTVDNGKAIAESLDKAYLKANPFFNTMLRMLTCRCMTQAVYFASGTLPVEQYFHFGLAAPIYTHFTSPIRRYADLMVHRLLAAAIRADLTTPSMVDKKRTQDVCANLNYRHKQAQYAGRASVLLNTHLFFKDKTEDLEGYVLNVRRNAIQVLIPKYGLESAVMVRSDSPFVFNGDDNSMKCGDVTLRTFDRIVVQLSLNDQDEQHMKLQLKLVDPAIVGFSVDPLLSVPENENEMPTVHSVKRAKLE